jgi:hypothetical protein
MLRRIFGYESKELEVGRRKLHNEGLNNLYSSTNYEIINSRGMRWAGHVLGMEH